MGENVTLWLKKLFDDGKNRGNLCRRGMPRPLDSSVQREAEGEGMEETSGTEKKSHSALRRSTKKKVKKKRREPYRERKAL